MSSDSNDIEEPIKTAPPEVEKIIREVIRVEKEKSSTSGKAGGLKRGAAQSG